MAHYLRLTLAGTSKPVLVNMDVVSTIREEGTKSRLFFLSADTADKIDVSESLADIGKRLEKWNA